MVYGCVLVLVMLVVLRCWLCCCVNSCRGAGCVAGRVVCTVVLWCWSCWGVVVLAVSCVNSCRVLVVLWCWSYCITKLCCGAGRVVVLVLSWCLVCVAGVGRVVVLVVMLCEFLSWCWSCCGIGRIVLRSCCGTVLLLCCVLVVLLCEFVSSCLVVLWYWLYCITKLCCGAGRVVVLVVLYEWSRVVVSVVLCCVVSWSYCGAGRCCPMLVVVLVVLGWWCRSADLLYWKRCRYCVMWCWSCCIVKCCHGAGRVVVLVVCCVNSCRGAGCVVVLVVLYYEALLWCWSCCGAGRVVCGAVSWRVGCVLVLVCWLCCSAGCAVV